MRERTDETPAQDAGATNDAPMEARDASSAPIETAPGTSQSTPQTPQTDTPNDAGSMDAATRDMPDAGTHPPAQTAPPPATTNQACSRDALRDRAETYLRAMATGNTDSLKLHPSFRYTENGQVQTLGLGAWLTRPRSDFSRHALDETHCSTATEAVLEDVKGKIVLGVRLKYVDDQLLEAEAQVVVPNVAYYEPDSIPPMGADPWPQAVPDKNRTPDDALLHVAERYFSAQADASLLPPHAPECKRRQNGKLMDDSGNCGVAPGSARFEQLRYPVIDETAGIVTAITIYRGYVGMYLFKVQDETIQNIEVVGGAMASSSGW